MSTIGQQARNIRKKAQRRVAKLDKLIASKDVSKNLRKSYQYERKEITKLIEKTYLYNPNTKKRIQGRTDENRKKALDNLSKANMRNDYLVKSRKTNNKVVEQQMRLAKAGEKAIYTKEEVQIFYAATKNIWSGRNLPATQRNIEIMRAFGTNDLQFIIEAVLRDYRQKKDEAFFRYQEMGLSDSEAALQWEIDTAEANKPTSPPYLGQADPTTISWENHKELFDLITARNA